LAKVDLDLSKDDLNLEMVV